MPDHHLSLDSDPDAETVTGRPRRYRLGAALLALGLVAAACSSDDSETTTAEPATSEDEMSDEEMSDDEMSDDEEMSEDEMSDDEMSEDEMSDDEMSDDEMSEDEMSDDEMSEDEMSDDEMSEEMNDLMSQIINRSDLTVLDDAVHAAGLQDTLHDDGPFTIFAPTDEAFEAYLGEMGMSAEEALADVDTLTTLLQAHVVSGTEDAEAVVALDGEALTTLAGNELAITVDGETVTVGDATVLETDITADNGVIHVIDTVLTPPAG